MHNFIYSKGSESSAAYSKYVGAKRKAWANLSRFERVSKISIGKEMLRIDLPVTMFAPIFFSTYFITDFVASIFSAFINNIYPFASSLRQSCLKM